MFGEINYKRPIRLQKWTCGICKQSEAVVHMAREEQLAVYCDIWKQSSPLDLKRFFCHNLVVDIYHIKGQMHQE